MNDLNKRKRRLPSIVRWIIWVVVAQFVLLNISSAIYAYRFTHLYRDSALVTQNSSSNIFSRTWKLFTGPKQLRSPIKNFPAFSYQQVSLKTSAGKTIDAWYSSPDSNVMGSVILFHGVTSNKATLLDEAYEFRDWGYRVLLIDFRGHGNSDGNSTTIGYRESEEVKLAYDYVAGLGEKRIFLYGVSMGAVVVAKAVKEFDLKPAGVILDMPFASLQSYLENRARSLGFPQQPFAALTTFWISLERGFNGYNHSTIDYVKQIECPVLMEWGSLDQFIRKEETNKIYNAIGGSKKRLVIYDRAGHESFLHNNPGKWRIEMEKFL